MHTAPPNFLALLSLAFGTSSVFAIYFMAVAPLLVLWTWAGLICGALGLRHARRHGFGGAYAFWGLVINGLCCLLYTCGSLLMMSIYALEMMR